MGRAPARPILSMRIRDLLKRLVKGAECGSATRAKLRLRPQDKMRRKPADK